MAGSVVGQLRAILGLDLAQYVKGLDDAQKQLRTFGRDMEKMGAKLGGMGKSMTLGITAPIAAAGAGIVKFAADFEKSMNGLAIATQASAGEMKQMNDLALELGKSTVFSASEAAGAMDALAKAGTSVTDILGGAAKAAVDLAAATGSELEPAANMLSDVMGQFKLKTSDLPNVINQITGAVNESKLDFEDFALGMGQAGGVAGGLGVRFDDFATALAAISTSFSSGSAAGTSFRTFLSSLVGKSDAARNAIHDLKLNFYDSTGAMKSMADIAEELKTKLGGFNSEQKSGILNTIFGQDASATAIALMDQGAAGLEKVAQKIRETDAAAQSAQRMKGFWAQMEQLGGALETLAIQIGQSGLLDFLSSLVAGLSSMVDYMASASPLMLNIGVVFAAIAAAAGPLLIAIGAVVSAIGTISTALVPLLAGTGIAGFGAALAAAAVAAAPFIATAAALAAAWALFGDKIGPVLSQLKDQFVSTIGPKVTALFQQIGATAQQIWDGPLGTLLKGLIDLLAKVGAVGVEWLGKLNSAFLSALGEVLIRALAATIDWLKGAFQMIGDAITVVSKLLTGDFSGAWQAAKAMVSNAVNNMLTIIGDLFGARLKGIMEGVVNQVKKVGDAFYWLWDVTVGHSYVPDMVDAIGENMGRLDKLMVEPADKATKKTADAFKEMQTQVAGILDGLFPATRSYREELEKLAAIEGATGLDPAVKDAAVMKQRQKVADARKEADEEQAGPALDRPDYTRPGEVQPLPGLPVAVPGMERMSELALSLRDTFDQMGGKVGRALGNIADGLLNAVIPALTSTRQQADMTGQSLSQMGQGLTSIFSAIFGRKAGSILGSAATIAISAFGGGTGGGSLPGFKDGTGGWLKPTPCAAGGDRIIEFRRAA